MRLVTGNTVSGAPASRLSAGIEVALWVVPPLAEEALSACKVGELMPELNELNAVRSIPKAGAEVSSAEKVGTATLGGGGAPAPTTRGTATVNWEGGHASIEVKVNGEAVHTQRLGAPGTSTEPAYFNDPVGPKSTRIQVEVPDAASAQQYQHSTIGENQGPYDLSTNSCLTYCGDVLRAGGCQPPGTSIDLAKWLLRSGVKL
jgi:hypothetical protein